MDFNCYESNSVHDKWYQSHRSSDGALKVHDANPMSETSWLKTKMIYILPVKEHFQVLLRYENPWSVGLAKSHLHGRNIYDGCCRLNIQSISWDFLNKSEIYRGLCEDLCSAMKLRSIFIDLMIGSLGCSQQTPKLVEVPCSAQAETKYLAKEDDVLLERQVFDEIPVREVKEPNAEMIGLQVFDEISDRKVEPLVVKEFDCKRWSVNSTNDVVDNESRDLDWKAMETKNTRLCFVAENDFAGDLKSNLAMSRPLPEPPPSRCSMEFPRFHGIDKNTSEHSQSNHSIMELCGRGDYFVARLQSGDGHFGANIHSYSKYQGSLKAVLKEKLASMKLIILHQEVPSPMPLGLHQRPGANSFLEELYGMFEVFTGVARLVTDGSWVVYCPKSSPLMSLLLKQVLSKRF